MGRCGSTSSVAAAWARAGGPLPVCVSADTQTGGRGQRGRRWQSPAGGCWFTLALAGDAGGAAADGGPGGLPLAAADAVRSGIEAAGGPRGIAVVVPNDLLLDGRKVAGLLCERLSIGKARAATLVGVGINAGLGPRPEDPVTGERLRRPAGAISTGDGRPVDPAALRAACVTALLLALG